MGYEGRIWGLIVSVPDHCLSFYFTSIKILGNGLGPAIREVSPLSLQGK